MLASTVGAGGLQVKCRDDDHRPSNRGFRFKDGRRSLSGLGLHGACSGYMCITYMSGRGVRVAPSGAVRCRAQSAVYRTGAHWAFGRLGEFRAKALGFSVRMKP